MSSQLRQLDRCWACGANRCDGKRRGVVMFRVPSPRLLSTHSPTIFSLFQLIRPLPQQNASLGAVASNGYCFLTFPVRPASSLSCLSDAPPSPPSSLRLTCASLHLFLRHRPPKSPLKSFTPSPLRRRTLPSSCPTRLVRSRPIGPRPPPPPVTQQPSTPLRCRTFRPRRSTAFSSGILRQRLEREISSSSS